MMSDTNTPDSSPLEAATKACWNTLWGAHAKTAAATTVVSAGPHKKRRAQRLSKRRTPTASVDHVEMAAAVFGSSTFGFLYGSPWLFEFGFAPHGGPVPNVLPGGRTPKKYEMVLTPETMKDWAEFLASYNGSDIPFKGVGSLVVDIDAMDEADSELSGKLMGMIRGQVEAPHLTLHGSNSAGVAATIAKLYGKRCEKLTDLGLVLSGDDRKKPLPQASTIWETAPNLAHFRLHDGTDKNVSSAALSRLEDYVSNEQLATLCVSSLDINAEAFEPLLGKAAGRAKPLDYLHLSVLKDLSSREDFDLGAYMRAADNVYLCFSGLRKRSFTIHDEKCVPFRDSWNCGVLLLREGSAFLEAAHPNVETRSAFDHSSAKSDSAHTVAIVKTDRDADEYQTAELLRRFQHHQGVPGGRFTLPAFISSMS